MAAEEAETGEEAVAEQAMLSLMVPSSLWRGPGALEEMVGAAATAVVPQGKTGQCLESVVAAKAVQGGAAPSTSTTSAAAGIFKGAEEEENGAAEAEVDSQEALAATAMAAVAVEAAEAAAVGPYPHSQLRKISKASELEQAKSLSRWRHLLLLLRPLSPRPSRLLPQPQRSPLLCPRSPH